MGGKHHPLELLGIGDKIVEHLRSEGTPYNEVMYGQRHQDRLFRASLIKGVELRLQHAGDELRRIRVPGAKWRRRHGISDLDRECGIAVRGERNLEQLASVSPNQVGKVVVPNARVPVKVKVLQ